MHGLHYYINFVKLFSAQFMYRSNIIRLGYLFRNAIYVKNISTSCEGVLYKSLHLLPKPQHEAPCSVYDVHDKNNGYVTIEREDSSDGRSRIIIYDRKSIIHLSDGNHMNDLYENDDILLTQEFKNVLSNSLFHYDANVVHYRTVEQQTLSQGLASFTVYQPFIIYSDFSLLTLNNENIYAETEKPQKNTETVNQKEKPTEENLLNVTNHLTDSLSNFFRKPHDFSIYRSDIVFQNNFKGIKTRGLSDYKKQMYLLQVYGHLYFAKVKVEILKITHHLDDGTVRVRWRFHGLPYTKVIFQLWKLKLLTWKDFLREESEWIDGFSIFSVDKNGRVYKHFCDKMIPDDDEKLKKPESIRTRILSLLGVPNRRPNVGGMHAMFSYPTTSHSVKIQEKIK